ncbi:hypothetical protein [Clostridium sardiniense]|uniref:hypothetical protein n=1 Tax=Clostridium sardiniense TaxID=29369 RepID=UPI003D327FE0
MESTSLNHIKLEHVERAYLTRDMKIKDKHDAFYFFSAMNLLNSYVKKNMLLKNLGKNIF